MEKIEVLILDSISINYKFSIHLRFKDKKELDAVTEALKPLGYTFRFPRR
ncbi:hypothetical protein ES703_02112 [subsurface metagenome]